MSTTSAFYLIKKDYPRIIKQIIFNITYILTVKVKLTNQWASRENGNFIYCLYNVLSYIVIFAWVVS